MSDKIDYENRLHAIISIPRAAMKTCPKPIGIYTEEAEQLYQWANLDFERLHNVGLSRQTLDELPIRVGVLRHAELLWQSISLQYLATEQEWAARAPEAYALRDELLRATRYALRRQDNAQRQLAPIAASGSHADVIQDLASLAVLGEHNSAALQAINFDLNKLKQAAHTAETMGSLLAQANGNRLGGNETKTRRDQAFTYLKEVVDDVRDCGQYVFYNEPERLSGYICEYVSEYKSLETVL